MAAAAAAANTSSAPHTTTAPFDPSYAAAFAAAARSAAPSSVALTFTVFLLLLFFICFFSIFARSFFSSLRRGTTDQMNFGDPRYYRRYLTSIATAAGLDAGAVRALPVLTYSGGAKEVGGCVVCLGEFEEEEQVKVIPGCGHVFHPDCIGGWLVLHGSCPICRCSHLFAAGAAAAAKAGEVWINFGSGGGGSGGGPHEEEENGSSSAVAEDGGARPEERKLVGLGRSESFRSCERGGRESCKTFLRRTCSF